MRFGLLLFASTASVLADASSGHASSVSGDPDAVAPSNVEFRRHPAQGHRILQDDMNCLYVEVVDSFQDGGVRRRSYDCENEATGEVYEVKGAGDESWHEGLTSGSDHITISRGSAVNEGNGTINMNGNNPTMAESSINNGDGNGNGRGGVESPTSVSVGRRSLAAWIGDRVALVVRITNSAMSSLNSTVSASVEEIRDKVFGGSMAPGAEFERDQYRLQSGFMYCSHDKLNIQPHENLTVTNSNPRNAIVGDIVDGVVEVSVATSCESEEGCHNSAMMSDVITALGEAFDTPIHQMADHVLFCMPRGTLNFNPFAGINAYFSVYPDGACTRVSTLMHEVGHNLNLGHSSEGDQEYGDGTCVMGSGGMCLNTPKTWQLGWMPEAQLTIHSGEGYEGRLKGQVNYRPGDNNQDPILIKINDFSSDNNIYVGFNHAISWNRDRVEAPNEVTVQEYQGTGSAFSWLEAKLRPGDDPWTKNMSDGVEARVEVQSIDDSEEGFAMVRVSYGRGCTDFHLDISTECNDNDVCTQDTCEPLNDRHICQYAPVAGCCGNNVCDYSVDPIDPIGCPQDCPPTEMTTITRSSRMAAGNVFDIRAKSDITIVGFKVQNQNAGPIDVFVYERSGGFLGFENDQAGWTPVLGLYSPATVVSNGEERDTELRLRTPVEVADGSTHAFHIHTGSGHTYELGDGEEGELEASNDDLEFYKGRACTAVFRCDQSDDELPRIMTGAILYYDTATYARFPSNTPTPILTCGDFRAAEPKSYCNVGMDFVEILNRPRYVTEAECITACENYAVENEFTEGCCMLRFGDCEWGATRDINVMPPRFSYDSKAVLCSSSVPDDTATTIICGDWDAAPARYGCSGPAGTRSGGGWDHFGSDFDESACAEQCTTKMEDFGLHESCCMSYSNGDCWFRASTEIAYHWHRSFVQKAVICSDYETVTCGKWDDVYTGRICDGGEIEYFGSSFSQEECAAKCAESQLARGWNQGCCESRAFGRSDRGLCQLKGHGSVRRSYTHRDTKAIMCTKSGPSDLEKRTISPGEDVPSSALATERAGESESGMAELFTDEETGSLTAQEAPGAGESKSAMAKVLNLLGDEAVAAHQAKTAAAGEDYPEESKLSKVIEKFRSAIEHGRAVDS